MSDFWSTFFSAGFVFIIIRVAAPLLYASMSSYVSSLAGIPNIAIEGIMNFGALFGVYFSAVTGSAWLGLLGAVAIGLLCGFVLAFFTLKMKADPIMIGIALNLFSADFSIWLLLVWTGSKGTSASLPSKVLPSIDLPIIKDIPVIGEMLSGHYFLTYLCVILAILLYILIYKTPFGLRMKACGLDADAAESVGIKVPNMRMIAALMSGGLAALGGAYLSMGYLSIFSSNMTASRGWIGVAAAAVGNGNLPVTILMTFVFALAEAIASELKLTIAALPTELIDTIPYVFVIIGLIIMSVRAMKKAKARAS